MEAIILIIIIFVLTFASGFFSASETALFSLSSMKIKAYQKDQDKRHHLIAQLVMQPRNLFVTLFILNISANILIQNVASKLFGETAGWAWKVGIPLLITVLFCEIIPKYIAIENNVRVAELVSPTIAWFTKVLAPFRKWILKITNPISRMMFFFLRKEDEISKEELEHVLKTSEEHGLLNADETELITGYLNLINHDIREIMRPREDIIYYDIEEPLTKLTYLFVDQQCTRIPVCKDDLEDVLGIIESVDFLIHRDEIKTSKDIIPHLAKPFFVPETTPARTLLKQLEANYEVLALVVDEYGSLTGLISHEDLVEIVVGEISDRRDQDQLYTSAGKDIIIASGKLELSTFNDLFEVELDSPHNMVTIGGWLMEQLGDIPKSGVKYETADFMFQILASDPNRIKRVYIRRKKVKK